MDNGRVIGAGPLADLQSDPSLPLAVERDATRARFCLGADTVISGSWVDSPAALPVGVAECDSPWG